MSVLDNWSDEADVQPVHNRTKVAFVRRNKKKLFKSLQVMLEVLILQLRLREQDRENDQLSWYLRKFVMLITVPTAIGTLTSHTFLSRCTTDHEWHFYLELDEGIGPAI